MFAPLNFIYGSIITNYVSKASPGGRYYELRITNYIHAPTGHCDNCVSPAKNKRSKQGREAYENQRNKILGSKTSFIEIDLLRAGEPMLILGASLTDYYILVSRGYQRPEADLYGFNLKEPIPIFPVPLKQSEKEPSVDLQKLLNEVYQKARFDLVIDYSQLVKPSLSVEEKSWIEEILR